ncbi:MAG TPA: hypothetical protein ENJ18_10935, partial [Nannocystis exedens]|nr:hypothetical protein [Nannocystis exedens]
MLCRTRLLALLILSDGLVLAGCGPQVSTFTTTSSNLTTIEPVPTSTSTTAGGSSSTIGGASTAGSSSAASTGEASTGEVSTSTTSSLLKLDVGSENKLDLGTPAGCQGKIDVLFVISTMPQLEVIQPQLLAAFPKFVDTIASEFENFDVHIMVVDADQRWGLAMCDGACPDILTCMR